MSLRLRLSYTDEKEMEELLKLLAPVLPSAEIRSRPGEPFSRLYLSWPEPTETEE